MKRQMLTSAAVSVALTAIFTVLYRLFPAGVLLSLAITFGTVGYHLWMRLLVGFCFNRFMANRADYRAWWFRPRRWEAPLYQRLGVKKWKKHLPTYEPELFSPALHSWDEIAQAMCQSELVHETNMPLSFLPLLAVTKFGALPVFLITSVLAAVFDGVFVIIQRYNRPRIIRLLDRQHSGKI